MLNLIVWNLTIDKMMVGAQKMEVSSCNLNFSTHSIEAVIVLTVLKLLTLDFAQMQHFGQVFLALTPFET
jgi:hypothetical protein